MANILVTGAAGYIGSVVCKMAKDLGHTVAGVDIESIKHEYVDRYMTGSCGDDWTDVISELKIDTVFHLAAYADVADSVLHPDKYFQNNAGETAKLIDNLISMGWEGKFIFSSTAAVYGDGNGGNSAFIEKSQTTPVNPYGESKLECEVNIEEACKRTGFRAAIFRYFNVVGADGKLGDHLDSGHVLQKMCKAALSNQEFKIFGHDLDTRDGTCVRDYVHVLDVARAHFHVSALMDSDPTLEIYNLGTHQGTSVKELLADFCHYTGNQVSSSNNPSRPGDPPYLVANPSKLVRTGFQYKFSDMETIIKSSWDSYKSRWNQ